MDAGLQQGIAAVRAGDKANAKRLLSQVVKTERDNETAWLWLSAAVDTDEQRCFCLEQVLRLNPGHTQARAALARLRPAPGFSSPAPAFHSPSPSPASSKAPEVFSEEPVPGAVPPFSFELEVPQTPHWLQPSPPRPSTLFPDQDKAPTPYWVGTPASAKRPSPAVPPTNAEPSFWEKPLAAPLYPDEIIPPAQPASKPRGYAWYHIWLSTLVSPNVENFRSILGDPRLSARRALGWIFAVMVVTLLPVEILLMVLLFSTGQNAYHPAFLLGVLAFSLVGLLLAGALQALIFATITSVWHTVAMLFGGNGKLEELLFATAAYNAPLLLVWSIIAFVANFLPLCGILAVPLFVYQLVLLVNALRAVYDFTTTRALGVFFATIVVLTPVCCLISYVLSTLQAR